MDRTLETTNWPNAFVKALAISRCDIPPADISTISWISPLLVRLSAAHNLDR
jgi:hypothetical protein